ncbi:MAG: DUF418 domain-containing protein [Bacteroidetes bacterium]|nr:DUF418 domain-containing protein [Bacteroidota bacterium]
MNTPLNPLQNKDRILFIDSLRGVAVFGILIVNIMGAGQAGQFTMNMNLDQPITGANFYTWAIGNELFLGAMRGIFSLLFGAGAVLLIDRLEKNQTAAGTAANAAAGGAANTASTTDTINPADIYYRRMLWMIGFGLFNAFVLLWWGDILFFYGVLGLMLWPFRKLTPRQLLIPIIIVLAIGVYKETASLQKSKAIITHAQQDSTAFQEFKKRGSIETARKDTKTFQEASLKKRWDKLYDRAVQLESVGLYHSWYDMFMLFLLGIALYRWGFLTGRKPANLYLAFGLCGTALSLYMGYLESEPMYRYRFDNVSITQHAFPIQLRQLKRIFQVVGYTSLLLYFYQLSRLFRRVFNLLAPAGQMAFTNYLSQSIFIGVFFVLLDYYGTLQRYQLFGLAIGFYILQVVFSHVWLRFFTFGPFEWAWRSLTYWKRQPMLKPSPR